MRSFALERLNNESKNDILAARVVLLQVSEVEGDFETATPLIFNRYTAYKSLPLAS